jgi:hypothetical protein
MKSHPATATPQPPIFLSDLLLKILKTPRKPRKKGKKAAKTCRFREIHARIHHFFHCHFFIYKNNNPRIRKPQTNKQKKHTQKNKAKKNQKKPTRNVRFSSNFCIFFIKKQKQKKKFNV